ncbi:MAG: hypothetical protein ACJA1A_002885 [Saprospiraceae bacterium]|jgi:hypothetical protein
MIDINLHQYKDQLKIKKEGNSIFIFDLIRKKYIVLQPEELVRQLLILHLIKIGYPKEKIQVEKGLNVNGLRRRFDVVVFDQKFLPYLLVECKSHTVPISQDTFDQIANYNIELRAPYLLVTNGIQTFCSELNFENKNITNLSAIPQIKK